MNSYEIITEDFTLYIFMNSMFASDAQDKKDLTRNPLLDPGTLPFRAAPFDKIKDADFRPAFEEGFKLQNAEIQKIADNPGCADI